MDCLKACCQDCFRQNFNPGEAAWSTASATDLDNASYRCYLRPCPGMHQISATRLLDDTSLKHMPEVAGFIRARTQHASRFLPTGIDRARGSRRVSLSFRHVREIVTIDTNYQARGPSGFAFLKCSNYNLLCAYFRIKI